MPRRTVLPRVLSRALVLALAASTLALAGPATSAQRTYAEELVAEGQQVGTDTMAVGSDGTVYVTAFDEMPDNHHPDPDTAPGVIRAFHPDGTVTDTDWEMPWVIHPSGGAYPANVPFDLGVDDAGNLYGYVVYTQHSLDESVATNTGLIPEPEIQMIAPGSSQPVVLPFDDLPTFDPHNSGGFGNEYTYKGIFVNGAGDVYAAVDHSDVSAVRVLRHGASHDEALPPLGTTSYSATDAVVDSHGEVYVISETGEGLQRLSSDRNHWIQVSEFQGPNGTAGYDLAVDSADRIHTTGAIYDPASGDTELNSVGNSRRIAIADDHVYIVKNGLQVYRLTEISTLTAENQAVTTLSGVAKQITVSASDSYGAALTYEVGEPGHGTVTGTAPDLTYTSEPGYVGSDSFSFTVTNPDGRQASAAVTITVKTNESNPGHDRELIIPNALDAGFMAATVGPDGVVYFADYVEATDQGVVRARRPDGTTVDTGWHFRFQDSTSTQPVPLDLKVDAEGNLYGLGFSFNGSFGAETPASVWTLPVGAAAPVKLPFRHLSTLRGFAAYQWGDLGFEVSPGGDVYVGTADDTPYGGDASNAIRVLRHGATADEEVSPALGEMTVDFARRPDGSLVALGASGHLARLDPGAASWTPLGDIGATASGDFGIEGTLQPQLVAGPDGTLYLTGRPRAAGTRDGLHVRHFDPDDPATHEDLFLSRIRLSTGLSIGADGSVYGVGEVYGERGLYRLQPDAPAITVTATDAAWTVPAGSTSSVVLAARSSDGASLTYSVTGGPSHGTLSGSGRSLSYTPDPGFTGEDAFTFAAANPTGQQGSGTIGITVAADAPASVTQPAPAGGTVTTGTSTTTTEPAQAAVTTPVAGDVTITRVEDPHPPTGYGIVGTQYVIEAPAGTAAAPLALTFLVDTSTLPAGTAPADVAVFRNGTAVAACADGSGTATPDPCISDRQVDGTTLRIAVLSSHASTWTTAVAARATTTSLTATPGAVEQATTLLATVRDGSSPVTEGVVEFREGGTLLGTAPVDSSGKATLSHSAFLFGTHQVIGRYTGDDYHLASTSAALGVPITSRVATTLVADPALIKIGPLLSLSLTVSKISARLTRSSGGAAVVGAPIVFKAGGTTVCTATTDGTGRATCTNPATVLSILTLGFTATYAGDLRYEPRTSTGTLIR